MEIRAYIDEEDIGILDVDLQYSADSPLDIAFVFGKGTEYQKAWRIGRKLLNNVVFRGNRNAGLGDIRVEPFSALYTRITLVDMQEEEDKNSTYGFRCVEVGRTSLLFPTRSLQRYLIKTYKICSPQQEATVLYEIIDREWLAFNTKTDQK